MTSFQVPARWLLRFPAGLEECKLQPTRPTFLLLVVSLVGKEGVGIKDISRVDCS